MTILELQPQFLGGFGLHDELLTVRIDDDTHSAVLQTVEQLLFLGVNLIYRRDGAAGAQTDEHIEHGLTVLGVRERAADERHVLQQRVLRGLNIQLDLRFDLIRGHQQAVRVVACAFGIAGQLVGRVRQVAGQFLLLFDNLIHRSAGVDHRIQVIVRACGEIRQGVGGGATGFLGEVERLSLSIPDIRTVLGKLMHLLHGGAHRGENLLIGGLRVGQLDSGITLLLLSLHHQLASLSVIGLLFGSALSLQRHEVSGIAKTHKSIDIFAGVPIRFCGRLNMIPHVLDHLVTRLLDLLCGFIVIVHKLGVFEQAVRESVVCGSTVLHCRSKITKRNAKLLSS